MPEEFTLKEILVKRAAVDGFEGSIFTWTTFMDRLCDDIFTNTCFTCDSGQSLSSVRLVPLDAKRPASVRIHQ